MVEFAVTGIGVRVWMLVVDTALETAEKAAIAAAVVEMEHLVGVGMVLVLGSVGKTAAAPCQAIAVQVGTAENVGPER